MDMDWIRMKLVDGGEDTMKEMDDVVQETGWREAINVGGMSRTFLMERARSTAKCMQIGQS